jgi:hypothetical protein
VRLEATKDGKFELWNEDGLVTVMVMETVLQPIAVIDGRIVTSAERRQAGEKAISDMRKELRESGPPLRLVK